MVKVGVGIPFRNFVSTDWAFCFRELRLPSHVVYAQTGNPVDLDRENIVHKLLTLGVDYIFFLDADVLVPADAVVNLLACSEKNNLPIVSGLYYSKEPLTPKPVAYKYDKKNVLLPLESVGCDVLVPVDVVGCGCLLVRSDVFQRLHVSDPDKPFFKFSVGKSGFVGEDVFFCNRCVNELNIFPHVLGSVKCHHEGFARVDGEGNIYSVPVMLY